MATPSLSRVFESVDDEVNDELMTECSLLSLFFGLQESGQIFDHDVCHCIYPATKTFLNSFYTLGKHECALRYPSSRDIGGTAFISGVVMLTVMVCCFLVFGVQKGDENVLNSSRGR